MNISIRTYEQANVITFCKTTAPFGGLSNMAAGFPLFVNDINIPNSEALYQACKFPLFPEIQDEIISQKSPIDSKKISQKYTTKIRQDWEKYKFDVMRWCLQVKLIQNWNSFSNLLQSTDNKPIVEYSTKDNIWGAMPNDRGVLIGQNALGRLLMELRENFVLKNIKPSYIEPLYMPAFLLFNVPISRVYSAEDILSDWQENLELGLMV